MRDIVKTVIILSVIAVISGALLGGINSITQIDAEEQLKAKLVKVYNNPAELTRVSLTDNPSLNPVNDPEVVKYGSVLDVFTAPDGTYVIRALGKGGYGGDIEMLYAIKDYKIIKIAVYKHAETPGLGSKGFEESYLARYIGKDIRDFDKFVLDKNPDKTNEIKAITGATYTSNAIINTTNIAALWYKVNGPESNKEKDNE